MIILRVRDHARKNSRKRVRPNQIGDRAIAKIPEFSVDTSLAFFGFSGLTARVGARSIGMARGLPFD
jgi:hypothetical protein